MDGLNPRGLAETLAEKHDRFIKKYSAELGAGERVSVLREKKDQLKHWVADDKSNQKHAKALAAVEAELKEIEDSGLLKPASYYKGLKEKIGEHTESKEYWVNKAREVVST
jgi:hypothetical protein